MNEKLINILKSLVCLASPVFIVVILFKYTDLILIPIIGIYPAYTVCSYLPVLYLMVVTALGYFNKVSLGFVFVSQISVACCGGYSSYLYMQTILASRPRPFTAVNLIHWFMVDDWYVLIFLFLIYGLVPISLSALSFRIMLKRPKGFLKEAKHKNIQNLNSSGSARFATKKEIEKLNTKKGIVVGKQATLRDYSDLEAVIKHIKTRKSSSDVIYQQPVHSILIAPSGYGKGVGIIIPTLLNYPGNVVVTDFKGENYHVVARRRAQLGKKVYAFEPFHKMELTERCKINVLDLLIPDSMDLINDSMTIAQLLCPIPQENYGVTKFFQENAGALIQCVILYVICSGEIPKGEQNLFKVCQLLHLNPEDKKELLKKIADSVYAFGKASRLASKLLGTHYEELSAIFSSAQTELRFLDDPYIIEATSCSNIDLREITTGTTDLFLCMPPEYVEDNPRVARLLTGMIFKLMEKSKSFIGKDKLLMLLDELPAYQYLPFVDKCLNHGRAFNVRLLGVAVSIERLKHTYPKSWQTFLGSELAIFCGFNEIETQTYVAKRLGKKTILVNSTSQSQGTHQHGLMVIDSSNKQESDNISETGRSLLTEDELSAIGDKVIIAFVKGGRPIICHKATYYNDQAWSGLWDHNPVENVKCLNKPVKRLHSLHKDNSYLVYLKTQICHLLKIQNP